MEEQIRSQQEENFTELYNALVYLALLAALEDGNVSRKEEKWAEKLTEIKSSLETGKLQAYYQKAKINFGDKMKSIEESLPEDTVQAKEMLHAKLFAVKAIINNNEDKEFVKELRLSLHSYAQRVVSTTENWGEIVALFANPMLGAEDAEVSP